jgi:hypothetical protein
MHLQFELLSSLAHERVDEARRAAEPHRQARQARLVRRLRPPADAPGRRQPRRDRTAGRRRQAGRALLSLAAVVAATASVAALTTLGVEPASSELLAAWRGFGLAVFGGLFALVASAPERYPGVLELAILHKVALTAWAMGSQAPGATLVVAADGILTLVLITAYLLLGSHRTWRPTHAEQL